MKNHQFNHLVKYLSDKGVSFSVSINYESNTESIRGIVLTKKGKFYRANGVIISKQFAKYFM